MAAPPQPTPTPAPPAAAGANGDAAFRLGFVGAGNLAESIARGVAASGVLPASAIRTAPHRRPERGAAFADLGARILASNAQGGGAVWYHGGVDGRPGEVNTLIPVSKMGERRMAAATSGACVMAHAKGMPVRFVLPTRYWAVW